MAKHLTRLVIEKHMKSMNLDFPSGRLAKAAKMHSILEKDRQMTLIEKVNNVSENYVETLGNDSWAERGEYAR